MIYYFVTKGFRIRYKVQCDECGSGPKHNVSGSTHLEVLAKAKTKGFSELDGRHLCEYCADAEESDRYMKEWSTEDPDTKIHGVR